MKAQHTIILGAIIGFTGCHGYPPSTRELMDWVGYASTSTVHRHLQDMRDAGIINFIDDAPRTITVPGFEYQKIC